MEYLLFLTHDLLSIYLDTLQHANYAYVPVKFYSRNCQELHFFAVSMHIRASVEVGVGGVRKRCFHFPQRIKLIWSEEGGKKEKK